MIYVPYNLLGKGQSTTMATTKKDVILWWHTEVIPVIDLSRFDSHE